MKSRSARLNLNLVARERIKTISTLHQLSSKLLDTKERDLFTVRDSLNSEYRGMVKLPMSAIYYPLPLALCEIVHQGGERLTPLRLLDKAFTLWCERISIGDKLVERPIKLEPEAVYALLLTEAVRRRLEGMERPSKLEDIRRLANFYRVVNESFYYLIMNEISHVGSSLDFSKSSGWVSLSQLIGGDEGRKMSPDTRVMIAHAGLQKELVEVNVQTRQLRYKAKVEDILDKAGLLLRFT